MRRLLLFAAFFWLLSFTALSQQGWVGFSSDFPELPQVSIAEQNESGLILEFTISGMYVSSQTEEGQTFQRLELIQDRTTKDVGKPELPMISELIGIPGNQLARVTILVILLVFIISSC